MMPVGKHEAPARSALFSYGQLAFPLSFAGLPIYLHAPDFYAAEYGVALAALGTVLLLLRVVDAIQDPVIGWVSDRYHTHRKSIVALGLMALATGFWMVFHPAENGTIWWFFLGILICTTGYSIVVINYQALGGLWRATTHQRTAITGWREALGLVGLLAAAILPTVLGSTENADKAFHLLSLIFLGLLTISAFLFFRWLASADIDKPDTVDETTNDWRAAFRSRWRRRFYAIYFFNAVASAMPAVLVIFFIRDRLEAEDLTGIFLLLYFVSGAIAMPLWQRVSSNVGKFRCWLIAMLVAILTFSWAMFLGPGDVIAYGIICVASGMALGADLALPPSMLADHISHRKAQAQATSFFAILAFLTKGSLALATGLVLPALGFAGYQPGNPVDDSIAIWFMAAYAAIPCLIKLVVAAALWKSLNRLEQEEREGEPALATC